LGFFLATIDEKKSAKELKEMQANKIFLVVPENIKNKVPVYKSALNVLTFESFFRHHLDPALSRWKHTGALDS
jgi:hypothetical protein